MELKEAEYHKVARKLKLIPLSAENAFGHDFDIKPFGCGSGNVVQHETQIKVPPAEHRGVEAVPEPDFWIVMDFNSSQYEQV